MRVRNNPNRRRKPRAKKMTERGLGAVVGISTGRVVTSQAAAAGPLASSFPGAQGLNNAIPVMYQADLWAAELEAPVRPRIKRQGPKRSEKRA